MVYPPVTPTADDVDQELKKRAKVTRIGRVLKKLGLMQLEDLPEVGLSNLKLKIAQAPQEIISRLRALGRTPDTEDFVRTLKPDADEEQFRNIFGAAEFKPPEVPLSSDKVTAPFSTEMANEIARQGRVERGEEWGGLEKFLSEQMGKLGMVSPALESPEAYRSAVASEQEAARIRRESFARTDNPIVNFANTPTAIFGLTPADIVGIGTIVAGGVNVIRSLTEFSRLPQYQAMQQVARRAAAQGKPIPAQVQKDAKTALQTAFNLQKAGMNEAADEIMARFNKAYGGQYA